MVIVEPEDFYSSAVPNGELMRLIAKHHTPPPPPPPEPIPASTPHHSEPLNHGQLVCGVEKIRSAWGHEEVKH